MLTCKVRTRNCAAHSCIVAGRNWESAGLAFTADSRQTEAGRLYNCPEEDETTLTTSTVTARTSRDFLTAFRSPVTVAKKRNCAFNTVRLSSAGKLWIMDNDSRGGDDEHAQAGRSRWMYPKITDNVCCGKPVPRPRERPVSRGGRALTPSTRSQVA